MILSVFFFFFFGGGGERGNTMSTLNKKIDSHTRVTQNENVFMCVIDKPIYKPILHKK